MSNETATHQHGTCADCNQEEAELVAYDKQTGDGVCWQCTDAPGLIPAAVWLSQVAK